MDKDTIRQIAAEVVARLPYGDRYWLFLAVNVGVMALAAGFAAWFGSFLKTKGQNFATKQDFDELLPPSPPAEKARLEIMPQKKMPHSAAGLRTKGNPNILTAAIVCVSSVRPFYGGRGTAQWRAERLQEDPAK
jgi:hypothetical protein